MNNHNNNDNKASNIFQFLGVSYMFDKDGRRITSLEQISDKGLYVCSSSKRFVPGNYGAFGDGFAPQDGHLDPRSRVQSRLSHQTNFGSSTNLFKKKISSAPSTISGDRYVLIATLLTLTPEHKGRPWKI
jgi:curved DNA-binding protein CbpA